MMDPLHRGNENDWKWLRLVRRSDLAYFIEVFSKAGSDPLRVQFSARIGWLRTARRLIASTCYGIFVGSWRWFQLDPGPNSSTWTERIAVFSFPREHNIDVSVGNNAFLCAIQQHYLSHAQIKCDNGLILHVVIGGGTGMGEGKLNERTVDLALQPPAPPVEFIEPYSSGNTPIRMGSRSRYMNFYGRRTQEETTGKQLMK